MMCKTSPLQNRWPENEMALMKKLNIIGGECQLWLEKVWVAMSSVLTNYSVLYSDLLGLIPYQTLVISRTLTLNIPDNTVDYHSDYNGDAWSNRFFPKCKEADILI